MIEMTQHIAEALADVEQWHQATIRAGGATRLLLDAAKRSGITEVQLARILEVTIPKLQWLSRRGLGPTKRVRSGDLTSK